MCVASLFGSAKDNKYEVRKGLYIILMGAALPLAFD